MRSSLLPPGAPSPVAIGTSLQTASSLLHTWFTSSQNFSHPQSSGANWKFISSRNMSCSLLLISTILIKSPSPLPASHGCTWYFPLLTQTVHLYIAHPHHALPYGDVRICAISSGHCGFDRQLVACDISHLGPEAACGGLLSHIWPSSKNMWTFCVCSSHQSFYWIFNKSADNNTNTVLM